MKQKEFTRKQLEILGQLEQAFQAAFKNDIKFIYDIDDNSMSAINGENVDDLYAGRDGELDGDEPVNWDMAHPLFHSEYFDSAMQNCYIKFK